MSYNVTYSTLLSGELFIPHREFMKWNPSRHLLPECNPLDMPSVEAHAKSIMAGSPAELIRLEVDRAPAFWWYGAGSWDLDRLREFARSLSGHAEIMLTWEGGNSTSGIRIMEGIVTEYEVKHTLVGKEKRRHVVCLCGSTRFFQEFQEANCRETMAGNIVLTVGAYPHAGKSTPEEKVKLDELHKDKIAMADEVLVLNVGRYIGESTASEIEHAMALRKPIRWLEAPRSCDACVHKFVADGHKRCAHPRANAGALTAMETSKIGHCGLVLRNFEQNPKLDDRGNPLERYDELDALAADKDPEEDAPREPARRVVAINPVGTTKKDREENQ